MTWNPLVSRMEFINRLNTAETQRTQSLFFSEKAQRTPCLRGKSNVSKLLLTITVSI